MALEPLTETADCPGCVGWFALGSTLICVPGAADISICRIFGAAVGVGICVTVAFKYGSGVGWTGPEPTESCCVARVGLGLVERVDWFVMGTPETGAVDWFELGSTENCCVDWSGMGMAESCVVDWFDVLLGPDGP